MKINLQKIFSILFVIFVIIPIFISAVGPAILCTEKVASSTEEQISRLIYLFSSVTSQIAFSLFSKLQSGFIMFPCFENGAISTEIHSYCKQNCGGLLATLICFFFASLITVVISFTISYFKLGSVLDKIPISIIFAMMIIHGAFHIYFGCSYYLSPEIIRSAILVTIALATAVVAIIGFKKLKNSMFLNLFMSLLIVTMHTLKLTIKSKEFFTKNNLFLCETADKLSLKKLIENLDFASLSLNLGLSQWLKIASLGISPILSTTVNLPAYGNATNIFYSFNSELFSLSMANLFSVFPAYFNCSGSIILTANGITGRLYCLLLGFGMISIYFIYHIILPNIPTFSMSLILNFIGISFILGYGSSLLSQDWLSILTVTLCMGVYALLHQYLPVVLFICILINFLVPLIFKGQLTCTVEKKGSTLLVKGVVLFHNYDKLLDAMDNDKLLDAMDNDKLLDAMDNDKLLNNDKLVDPVTVIDMRRCKYVDMTARQRLTDRCRKMLKSGAKVSIVNGVNMKPIIL